MPTSLLKARQVAEVVSAETLLDRLKGLYRETAAILREARLLGELSDSARIAVGVNLGLMSDPARRLAEPQAGRERARKAGNESSASGGP